ncbi:MAG: hypothetical protein V9G20_27990 [Candidatus Promineifilaceae bacterium]
MEALIRPVLGMGQESLARPILTAPYQALPPLTNVKHPSDKSLDVT